MNAVAQKIHRDPVDRVAARVVAPSNNQAPLRAGGVSQLRFQQRVAMVLAAKVKPPKRVKNLIGKKSGRLVVVGYGWRNGKQGNHHWIVRCQCGRHEARSATTITRDWTQFACCQQCEAQKGLIGQTEHTLLMPRRFRWLAEQYPEIPATAYRCDKCTNWFTTLDHFWPFMSAGNYCVTCVKRARDAREKVGNGE